MIRLAAPTPADVQVFAVNLVMDVDAGRTGVGIVAGNHVAAAVADEFETPLRTHARSQPLR